MKFDLKKYSQQNALFVFALTLLQMSAVSDWAILFGSGVVVVTYLAMVRYQTADRLRYGEIVLINKQQFTDILSGGELTPVGGAKVESKAVEYVKEAASLLPVMGFAALAAFVTPYAIPACNVGIVGLVFWQMRHANVRYRPSTAMAIMAIGVAVIALAIDPVIFGIVPLSLVISEG
jgi:hypothetical protein